MAERPDQNWQNREYVNFGPGFRIDTGNPQMGLNGSTVYDLFGSGADNNTSSLGMTNGGLYHIYNDQCIDIVGGAKAKDGECCINIIGKNGDVTITAMANGQVKITGKNITIDADEDIKIDAGKKMTLKASNEIELDTPVLNTTAMAGNLAPRDVTFGGLVFSGTEVGTPEIAKSFTGGSFKSPFKDMASSMEKMAANSGINAASIESAASSLEDKLGGLL
tara:strand:+ start:342 stop:1004 length:663 start_codon:yes stop_codon:yes gene_type:complete